MAYLKESYIGTTFSTTTVHTFVINHKAKSYVIQGHWTYPNNTFFLRQIRNLIHKQ